MNALESRLTLEFREKIISIYQLSLESMNVFVVIDYDPTEKRPHHCKC